ncbi:MAG: shikimate synthase [Bdellovibrio sp. ArHS]|uniref:shikimate kinase n=1 Tax=Bdellovibrio sp. ArHS TaxID=1569284 RepID=UPI00058358B8|nr:shikimate kinase [Bdellovibrio sp. ArHS]KHD88708.1 MAG: shikimate synthase [Bdellovibrio sp. ArHS]
MITVVVGHRGTGKTELMKRLQLYWREDVDTVDLDTEIEKKIGKSIRELFMEHGEAYFREMERQLFLEILQKPSKKTYLVLGAGFDLSVIPENIPVLWVQRGTDLDGRIFLNRPRLEPDISPLEEFHKRAQVRQQRYSERADEIYLMPEGPLENHHRAMAVEKEILSHTLNHVSGILTLLPEVFSTDLRWSLFKSRYASRGLDSIELRDDLLTDEQMERALQEMPKEKFIFSIRKSREFSPAFLSRVSYVDWAWELGEPTEILAAVSSERLILSLHRGFEFLEWSRWEEKVAHMKFAPEISTFKDLAVYHEWQQESVSKRSFLPRSKQGRWEWYRRRQKGRQLLNFIREGSGSALDQPSLWSWLMTPSSAAEFAAVLGAPVAHSFTPVEQSDYFSKKDMPVLAVHIEREEWDEALPVLRKLGLTHAAVTAPHKENAAKLCHHPELKAVNTLYWNKKQQMWQGTSTDEEGFVELIEGVGMLAPLQKEIFVWGGGGTLEVIRKALPHASYFSSRTALVRSGSEGADLLQPKIVIWAAPRSAETKMPPTHWNPVMVFDLNYKEDSLGREYAQACGANYQSGLVMFTAQAQGQRLFWRHCEENL